MSKSSGQVSDVKTLSTSAGMPLLFRVGAALTGDAPHRSGRDRYVIRLLSNQGLGITLAYDNAPKQAYTFFVILGFGSFQTFRNTTNFSQLI